MMEELIRQCKSGSRQAHKLLYEHCSPRIFRIAYRYVKDETEAEDILLNTFIKIFAHLKEFNYQGEGSFYSWIKKIVVNECLMFLRKNKGIVFIEASYATQIQSAGDIESTLGAEEIYNLILALPTGYRTIFNLYVIEGFNHKEIAGILKISEHTSRSQLSKARACLRELLIKNGIEYGN